MKGDISLSCRELERYLGEEEERVHALRGVSLHVEAGSLHAVVGPSGCGKSTLLYILGLLDKPDAGSVQIGSTQISELSDEELARRRNQLIGFIFQFHFLMEDFTAHENVMIPMRRLGQLSEEEMAERALDCWKPSLLETNFDAKAVIFPEANNNEWLSRAPWPTIHR